MRGANLADIYDDAGLTEVAFREAVRAVHDDYANFSTHLFLANSYNRLRDPRQVNVRYETPWLSEYLVANLLAPVGAGTLSQLVSTEEYSRLFERNRLGLVSVTEYLSNGDWLQAASQYGRFGNVSYALDEYYASRNGFRPNNDLDELSLSAQIKLQLTPQDDVFIQGIYQTLDRGDLAQLYSESMVNSGLRFKERLEPIVLAGYHHAWTPGSHTLALATRLSDTASVTNPIQSVIYFRAPVGPIVSGFLQPLALDYRSELEIYTGELQHFWDWGSHRTIVGGRYQTGEFETRNTMPGFIVIPATTNTFATGFQRASAYAYHHWEPITSLRLIGGVSYDWIKFPENFRSPPISEHQETKDQVSPKAGVVWSPAGGTTVRAAYTRSLGGASIDQSFQLEPSQIAGFVQTFRSLIPESVSGAISAPRYETFGIALDQKFATRTYLGISGEWLESEVTRRKGIYLIQSSASRSTTPEQLDFAEKTLQLTLNQLVGEECALGLVYRYSEADLESTFTGVPSNVGTNYLPGRFLRHTDLAARLHQVCLRAAWNSPSGFFANFDSVFSSQDNRGYVEARPGDEFWQFNVFAGFRFLQRRAEVGVGVLNLTDQDYQLNPLNLTPELPRERTLALRVRLAF